MVLNGEEKMRDDEGEVKQEAAGDSDSSVLNHHVILHDGIRRLVSKPTTNYVK